MDRIKWDDEWISNNLEYHSSRETLWKAYMDYTGVSVKYRSFQSHCYAKFGAITSKDIIWHDDWILEHINDVYYKSELRKLYNDTFDCAICKDTWNGHINRLGIISNSSWTSEENDWIKLNYHTLGCNGITEFNSLFGHNRSIKSLVAQAHRLGCYVDADSIERNRVFSRRVPIGTIVDDGDGYLKIKTGKGTSGWERYHRFIYEITTGTKIPNGYRIMFLDNDKRNIDTDNLAIVPYSYGAIMNNCKLKSTNPTVTKAGILWCDLYTRLLEENVLKGVENDND